MKRETFYAELFRRLGAPITLGGERAMLVRDYGYKCIETIDAMTGGKLFAGVDAIPEDWRWPE